MNSILIELSLQVLCSLHSINASRPTDYCAEQCIVILPMRQAFNSVNVSEKIINFQSNYTSSLFFFFSKETKKFRFNSSIAIIPESVKNPQRFSSFLPSIHSLEDKSWTNTLQREGKREKERIKGQVIHGDLSGPTNRKSKFARPGQLGPLDCGAE